MRRMLVSSLVAAVLASLLASCADRATPVSAGSDAAGAFHDDGLLLVRSGDGLAAVDPGTGAVQFSVPNGVPSGSGSTIFKTTHLPSGRTRVASLDPLSGAQQWSMELDETMAVRAVSDDGGVFALTPGGSRSAYTPVGRERTSIVVVRPDDDFVRRYDLAGNLEPEAFTASGRSLFVIEYLPPMEPDRYQVRRLDLTTGTVEDVYSVDKHLQEEMGGTAHSQALAPDGSRLYTLYTVGEGAHREAFVHVLSIDDEWAHCVLLPAEFAGADERAVALAPSPDGERLYVADVAGGQLAVVDTETLRTVSTKALPPAPTGDRATAVVAERAGRETIYVARGSIVLAIGRGALSRTQRWSLPEEVTGLHVSGDGDHLYVAGPSAITVLGTRDGDRLGELSSPMVPITQLGSGPGPVPTGDDAIQCAC